MCERVLSGEVELRYVRTDRQIADIFTEVSGSNKWEHFSEMLGMQRLDVPHMRGRMETNTGTEEVSEEKKNETRADEEKKGAESTEEVGTSNQSKQARDILPVKSAHRADHSLYGPDETSRALLSVQHAVDSHRHCLS